MRSWLMLGVAGFLAVLSSSLFGFALRGEDTGRLMVDEVVKDVGRLRQGQTVPAEFRLTNGMRDPIEIVEILPSCTCTVVSQGETRLAPGVSTKIRAAYDAHGSRGRSSTTLTIRYKIPDGSWSGNLAIEILAEVEPDYDVSAARLDFPSSGRASRSVVLKPRLVNRLIVSKATWNHPAFDARIVEPQAGDSNWSVDVTLDPDRLAANPLTGSEQLGIVTNNEHEPVHHVRLAVKP